MFVVKKMANYYKKTKTTKKSEMPHKAAYTLYYPHDKATTERNWKEDYYQVASIDPARINYALRIERRYKNGWITPIAFNKVKIECFEESDGAVMDKTYDKLTEFLDDYKKFLQECHFVLIERQMPDNYRAVRISQHTISYFLFILKNNPLLPGIYEVDPKLKGKILGAPKGLTHNQLKSWSVNIGRELLTKRNDEYSLGVLNVFKNKQDDLTDTICQIEALFIYLGYNKTEEPPKNILGAKNKMILELI